MFRFNVNAALNTAATAKASVGGSVIVIGLGGLILGEVPTNEGVFAVGIGILLLMIGMAPRGSKSRRGMSDMNVGLMVAASMICASFGLFIVLCLVIERKQKRQYRSRSYDRRNS